MQGMLIEWSPPSTTGSAPASRILRTPSSMLAWLRDRVGVDDVGIADVDDARRRRQVDDVVLVVVGAGVAEGEQRRGLADGARAEAGAGAPLGAEVEGRAEHGDVGVDGVPVELKRVLAEGRDADEGQVQPAVVVGVGHVVYPAACLARFAAITQRSSNMMVAPTSAVLPLGSKGGDTSTTSPPTEVEALQAAQHVLRLQRRQAADLRRARARRIDRIEAVDVEADVGRALPATRARLLDDVSPTPSLENSSM